MMENIIIIQKWKIKVFLSLHPMFLKWKNNDVFELIVLDVMMELCGLPSHGITNPNWSPISVHVILVEIDVSML